MKASSSWFFFDFCTTCFSFLETHFTIIVNFSGYLRGHGKYPFSQLFSKMKSSLPASKVQELMALYDIFKVSKWLSNFGKTIVVLFVFFMPSDMQELES